jgi:predicted nucleic acid-binding protein
VRDAILVDAGPLVALIDRSDPHHSECRRTLQGIRGMLLTVWPVLTEAVYLLGFSNTAQKALLEMVELGTLRLAGLDAADVLRVRELMSKYEDLPMDLADAALVRVAERERIRKVFTIDKRDFTVYRPLKIGRFAILP